MPDERRHNLPAHPVRLIGRDAEVVAVRERLLGAERGLLTLTGAGGAGKTSLALQVARGLLDDFPDGVWLVELAPLSDPNLVVQAVASVFDVREGSDRPLRDALAAYLEPRRLLLVLDNCEHLIEAAAALADVLLGRCPHLRLLATGREPLRISGEVVRLVPPLAAPDPERLPPLDELAEMASVRLFLERVCAVQSDFALTDDNARAVAEICARLDGIPLALELAAARVGALSVDQLAARLDDAFRLLTRGSRAAPSRQQTLEAALDWSYDLLPVPERAVLRHLSVFAGGWDLEATMVVCAPAGAGPDEVLDVLTRLVDKSLVVAEERGGEARYRLLEPVRQYALERLKEGDDAAVAGERHASHFLAVAEAAEPELRGPDQAAWLARLEREHANLRAALSWAEQRGEWETILRLGGAVHRFWLMGGHAGEGRRWLEPALAGGGDVSSTVRAKALLGASFLAEVCGEHQRALALAEEGHAAHHALGDERGVAWCQHYQAFASRGLGDPTAAQALEEEALVAFRRLGDNSGAGLSLYHLGDLALERGDQVAARALSEEALACFRAAGDPWLLAMAPSALAKIALAAGDPDRAAVHATDCLAQLWRQGDRQWLPMLLLVMAEVARARGQGRLAARLGGAAEAQREAIGGGSWIVYGPVYQEILARARQTMASANLEAAWAEGEAQPLDEAVAEALDIARPDPPATARPPVSVVSVLTPREREVAALVARGLTSRQIAEELVIAHGTARVHVERLLGKLGLHSRAQLAAWATQHGLLADRPG